MEKIIKVVSIPLVHRSLSLLSLWQFFHAHAITHYNTSKSGRNDGHGHSSAIWASHWVSSECVQIKGQSNLMPKFSPKWTETTRLPIKSEIQNNPSSPNVPKRNVHLKCYLWLRAIICIGLGYKSRNCIPAFRHRVFEKDGWVLG